MKTDLREIYGAPTRAAAEAAIDVFAFGGLFHPSLQVDPVGPHVHVSPR
jgi:hypothetical protein